MENIVRTRNKSFMRRKTCLKTIESYDPQGPELQNPYISPAEDRHKKWIKQRNVEHSTPSGYSIWISGIVDLFLLRLSVGRSHQWWTGVTENKIFNNQNFIGIIFVWGFIGDTWEGNCDGFFGRIVSQNTTSRAETYERHYYWIWHEQLVKSLQFYLNIAAISAGHVITLPLLKRYPSLESSGL